MHISGTGLYAPGDSISNTELKKLADIEFDSERHEAKLGIERRHIAHLRGMNETTADFAEKAARAAIVNAELSNDDINLFVVATDTPEYISPATSIIIQGRLQGKQSFTGAFDLSSSCASFVTALDTVARYIDTDPSIEHACIIGVYNMPALIRKGDAFGYSIFADGAAAFVLSKSDQSKDRRGTYLGGSLLSDGTQWNYIGVYSGGTRQPITRERLDSGDFGLQLLQRLPGDRNVKLWPVIVDRLLSSTGLSRNDIDHYLFTQINRSVILEVMKILGISQERTTTIMDRYGYTGSACIPMAFHTAVEEDRIKRGDKVLTVASGAGLAVAASVFIY